MSNDAVFKSYINSLLGDGADQIAIQHIKSIHAYYVDRCRTLERDKDRLLLENAELRRDNMELRGMVKSGKSTLPVR